MSILRVDPQHLTLQRRQLLGAIRSRFVTMQRDMWEIVVTRDMFGLRDVKPLSLNTQWKHLSLDQQQTNFSQWLQHEFNATLLQTDAHGNTWIKPYVERAYERGIARTFEDTHRVKRSIRPNLYEMQKLQFVRMALANPAGRGKEKVVVQRAFDQLKGVTDDIAKNASRVVTVALTRRVQPKVLAHELVNVFKGIRPQLPHRKSIVTNKRRGTDARSAAITNTELSFAHSEGQLDAMEALGLEDVEILAEWVTADNPCDECEQYEGQVFSLEVAHGVIPLHPHCVTGDMRIESPDPLAVMKSRYTGEIFDFTTGDGRRISVTGNHIMLTQRGWVRAKDITNADYFFDASSFDSSLCGHPNDDNCVPCIGDLFESLVETPGVGQISSPQSPEYLHGDGRFLDQKIDIINLNGVLGYDVQSQLNGEFCKLPFMLRNRFLRSGFPFTKDSNLSLLFERTARTADRRMSRFGVSPIFLNTTPLHHKLVGFEMGSGSDTIGFQHSVDNASIYTKLFSDFVLRNTLSVLIDDGFDLLLIGDTGQKLPVDHRFSFVSVPIQTITRRHVCKLPVYDVSTKSTMYLINGLLSSNCRCCWAAVDAEDLSYITKEWYT